MVLCTLAIYDENDYSPLSCSLPAISSLVLNELRLLLGRTCIYRRGVEGLVALLIRSGVCPELAACAAGAAVASASVTSNWTFAATTAVVYRTTDGHYNRFGGNFGTPCPCE